MLGYPVTGYKPYCQICGAVLENTALHRMFHESLDALVRRVVRPEMTEDEWRDKIDSPEFRLFADVKKTQRLNEIHVELEAEETLESAQAQLERESVSPD